MHSPVFRIDDQLTSLLQPSALIITNDSWQHRHHAPMRASGGGSGETRKLLLINQVQVVHTPETPSQIFP